MQDGTSGSGHDHRWRMITPDPDNWDDIAAIIETVLLYGVKSLDKMTSEGQRYASIMEIGGHIVKVVYIIIDGVLHISDAWVK